jgi:uncharacterized protein YbbC (DUF1343 family)
MRVSFRRTHRTTPRVPVLVHALALCCALGGPPACSREAAPPPQPGASAVDASQGSSQTPPAEPARAPQTPPTTSAVGVDAAAPAGVEALDLTAIDALIAHAIASKKLPGAVLAVGTSDRVLALRAYGRRAIVPAPEPMTTDTLFDLASLTKPVATASAVMALVDAGKLRLEDRARRHLPELDRSAARVTVRQLLLHASGLPHVDPLRPYDAGPAAGLAAALSARPEHPPGSGFHYGDLGYIWLGELVRRVGGEPLDAFTERALFAPLGMRDTRWNPPASWIARIAPTEITEQRGPSPVLIRGLVHDPRAYRLGGVAGHAGLFSSAGDLSRFARMLLQRGALDGVRVLSAERVVELTTPVPVGDALRTPGWDAQSAYSRLRGTRLSPRAFGHGGHTGVSLWLDPGRNLFVLFLSNRVHPDGKGDVISLIGAVTDAVVDSAERAVPCVRLPSAMPGIDALREQGFAAIAGKRIALVTHLAARARDGTPTLEVLRQAPNVTLTALLTPEHGLASDREGAVKHGHDAKRDLPLYSLFGKIRRPTAEMLRGADAIVVDLVDVGARFYTYMSTLHEVLRAGAELGREVIVLDRPNPIGGERVDGPLLDPDVHSFVNHHPLPIVHGMTAGELARLIADDERLAVKLTVIDAGGWHREQLFDETRLRWYPPSPNLPRSGSALLYPAIGLLESTNVSVGRGTDKPFEHFGAPWIDAQALLATVRAARLPGIAVRTDSFTPNAAPYRGKRCHGLLLRVTDARAFDPVRTGLVLASALITHHRDAFVADDLHKLVGNRAVLSALQRGASPHELAALYEPELAAFRERRARVLRYPSCGQAALP